MLCLLALLLAGLAPGQTAVVSVSPDADAFVWSLAPDSNYGDAGALSVSGSTAVNNLGQQEGLFDSLMRFPSSNVVASLNYTLGTADWIVTSIRLIVNEDAEPDNAIFNRGVGAFQVFWLAADTWTEGTGTPRAPTTDGVTWDDLSSIVNSNLDISLGEFTNAGVDGPLSLPLALTGTLLTQLTQGAEVGLHLTAASPEIGFTFYSRNFGNTNDQPELEITAAVNPEPQIDRIMVVGNLVFVSFATVSNWTYTLQGSTSLETAGVAGWTNLLALPAQPVSTNILYQEATTNRSRFYRLSVSP